MPKPKLLDLFCGAGGASTGYYQAGFDVTGVDINPQPNYPFEFIQADALTKLADPDFMAQFDAVHASPPCQAHSTVSGTARRRHGAVYVDLIPQTRAALIASGCPYVIENVIGAPLINPIMLCGSSFNLNVRRHRIFESSVPIAGVPCDHDWQTPRFRSLDGRRVAAGKLAAVVGVHGNTNYSGEFALRCEAMGIDWMTNGELTQAIPPAYTRWVGARLLAALAPAAVAA